MLYCVCVCVLVVVCEYEGEEMEAGESLTSADGCTTWLV